MAKTPFKQMGSAPMTRNQARTLSQKHMEGGAYTTMPGESRFQMSQRLRRAGKIGDTDETYIGKHLEANKMKREGEGYEGKTARKGRRKDFKEDIKGILGTVDETVTGSGDDDPVFSPTPNTGEPAGDIYNLPGDTKYEYRRKNGGWQGNNKDDDNDWFDIPSDQDDKLDTQFPTD